MCSIQGVHQTIDTEIEHSPERKQKVDCPVKRCNQNKELDAEPFPGRMGCLWRMHTKNK